MILRSAFAGLLLAALPANALAADQCLTREEAKGLAMFILPDVVSALGDKCRAVLPRSAYLMSADASGRFRAEAEKRWPVAKQVFGKFAGGGKTLDLIGDGASRKLLTGAITNGVTEDVKPKSCAGADRMLAALAPLPVSNVDMLLESFFLLGLGSDAKSQTAKFNICPEAATAGANK